MVLLERSDLSRKIPTFDFLVKEAICYLEFGLANPQGDHKRSSFKELQYICDGDSNGVVYFIGTSFGEHQWVNPVLAKVTSRNTAYVQLLYLETGGVKGLHKKLEFSAKIRKTKSKQSYYLGPRHPIKTIAWTIPSTKRIGKVIEIALHSVWTAPNAFDASLNLAKRPGYTFDAPFESNYNQSATTWSTDFQSALLSPFLPNTCGACL
ncbi:hypothetical protein TEA_023476 [Camellia sinensis var. sinensis]|uniref:Uncharacterized protein n=1 Tax=Camellia sinensis var. sinensis TaxID=542762 RepID=A0A4S4DN10_CAMSN|nr:hypothetical protein TEA_023476 [Camellia sinensis var. sinensis]